MKTSLNFNPVDIINNEVICAGQQGSNAVLVHCRVNAGGLLEFTVRSSSAEMSDQVIREALTACLSQSSGGAGSNILGSFF